MYVKINALPDRGYIIKIPFDPNLNVENQWLNGYNIKSIDKVFILFPNEGAPYLLVLDNKERPYFYNFDCDTNRLFKSIKFEPGKDESIT